MYVRITTGSFDPAKEPEVQQLTDEKYIPLLRQLPGLHSYLGSIDRVAGRALAITVWDSLEHAQAALQAIGGLAGDIEAASLRLDPSQVFEVTREI